MRMAEAAHPSRTRPTVYIIDDDPAIRQGLRARIEGDSFKVQIYPSAESFLEDMDDVRAGLGCVVADVYMREISGIELLRRLRAVKCDLPMVLMSGAADVPAAVRGMKLGAVDFLQKPVDPLELMGAIQGALGAMALQRRELWEKSEIRRRFAELSPRELDVLRRVVRGDSSKMIAHDLRISIKTVSHHRTKILAKSGACNTADVARLAQLAEIAPAGGN